MPIRLEQPLWLLLLPVLLLIARRQRPVLRWYGVARIPIPPSHSWRWRFRWLPGLLKELSTVAIVVALCQPVTPLPPIVDDRDGLTLVFLVDVSGSMGMEDAGTDAAPMSRLASVRPLIQKVMASRSNDRMAVIAFARTARVVCPMTRDHTAAMAMLDQLEVDLLDNKTNLGDAVVLGLGLLREAGAAEGRLIACSDGAHNVAEATDVATAARLAEAVGVPVHTIQMGRDVPPQAQETLSRLADVTGGIAGRAMSTADLAGLADNLAAVDPSPLPETRPAGWRDQTRPVLLLAALLLIVSNWWQARWWREPPPIVVRP